MQPHRVRPADTVVRGDDDRGGGRSGSDRPPCRGRDERLIGEADDDEFAVVILCRGDARVAAIRPGLVPTSGCAPSVTVRVVDAERRPRR